MDTLRLVHSTLLQKKSSCKNIAYAIPSLWQSCDFSQSPRLISVNPAEFFSEQIDKILKIPRQSCLLGRGGSWSQDAIVYNLFVRLFTAFDHDGDGVVRAGVAPSGFRETGTFLKTIALLPYIKKMGFNTLHLLPITAIGTAGRKGALGSPYAMEDPYLVDENSAEPFLGLGAETEFLALVEAAHHLGLRVVLEFIFRTASIDSAWVKEHPDWFYWIDARIPDRKRGENNDSSYGMPVFSPSDVEKIRPYEKSGQWIDTIPPSQRYRNFFKPAPKPGTLKKVNALWTGQTEDGEPVRIPAAFADWPVDDQQPPWDDVTYLKLYQHPQFNYIAYNTVRMYDAALTQQRYINQELWNKLTGIVPHYQKQFGIDGVMVDMGHALPLPLLKQIVEAARKVNPEFAFWSEDFAPTKHSRENGYNAAVGYLLFDQSNPGKMKGLVWRYSQEEFPLPFFGTAENHNSPRAASGIGGIKYSAWTWAVNNLLPVIPYLHNGFELGETFPVNTGLNFSQEDWQKYPQDRLPLFNVGTLAWMAPQNLCAWVAHWTGVRQKYGKYLAQPNPQTVKYYDSGEESNLLAFSRICGNKKLQLCVNMDTQKTESPNQISGIVLAASTKLTPAEQLPPCAVQFTEIDS